MKIFIALIFSIFFIIISNQLFAQGYFVASAGDYINSGNFKTNIQKDLSKYSGTYVAASETYESNYTFIVTDKENVLDILIVSAACEDGENWQQDTLAFKDVIVKDGKFTINDVPGNFGNKIFRFVKATYKLDSKSVKAEGLVMEEYFMFAEKSE
jgi:hypothetical protein